MSTRNFRAMLEDRWSKGRFVCVGLDSEVGKIPQHLQIPTCAGSTILGFNQEIIKATADIVCAYKPNSAFYEAHGERGMQALDLTIRFIKDFAPEVPIILDAKRGDIGNTNVGYIESAFQILGADAITVHPYLGKESLQPFLDQKDKGVIVLCRTSNKGAIEFQDLTIAQFNGNPGCPKFTPLYQFVAKQIAQSWNGNGNCLLVVGATYPKELAEIREIVGDMPILIPGIGAQGGDIEKTIKAGKDSRGMGMIINSSRGIIFASSGEDFAEAARRETLKLNEEINKYR